MVHCKYELGRKYKNGPEAKFPFQPLKNLRIGLLNENFLVSIAVYLSTECNSASELSNRDQIQTATISTLLYV